MQTFIDYIVVGGVPVVRCNEIQLLMVYMTHTWDIHQKLCENTVK